MQCTSELHGTATLVGTWSQEAMDALNQVSEIWASITDGYGFEQLDMGTFSPETHTVPISGSPNGIPGIALWGAWSDWFYQTAKEQAPKEHQALIRHMAEEHLSIFLYFLEENECDGELSGETGSGLITSDGSNLIWEKISSEAWKDLIRRRQETGFYEIYVDYFKTWEEDEDEEYEEDDWDEEEEEDAEGWEDEEEDDGEEDNEADAWDAEFEQRWNKGRTEDWLYEIQEDDTVSLVRYVGPGGAVTVPAEMEGHPVTYLAGQGTLTTKSRWGFSSRWRNGALRGRTDVTAVVLPEGLQAIGDQAFQGCTALISVTLPASLTSIGNEAFRGCTALTSVTLPASLTSIGYLAFRGCTALEELELPSACTKLDWGCFTDCSALRRVSLSPDLNAIPQNAFQNCTSLTEITIPDQVLEIGAYAFTNCTALARLSLGAKVQTLSNAFQDCTALTSVVLPGCVEQFSEAFQRCGLETVTLSEGIKAVDNGAFAGCTQLTQIQLPESLRRIEDGAFARCTALPAITIPTGVKFVGEAAFLGCTAFFANLLGLTEETDYDLSASYNAKERSWNTWTITGYHGPDTDLTVPGEVAGKAIDRIAPEAFAGYTSESCARLRRVVLPHGIRDLYVWTFKDCKQLEEVVLPDTLEELSEGVFEGCDQLHHLTVPASVTYFNRKAIPDRADLTLHVQPGSVAEGFAKANWEKVTVVADA